MTTQKKARFLLKKYSTNEKSFKIILEHSKSVQKAAVSISKKIKNADINFIKTASLLHDIGRFIYPPGKESIRHGIAGAEILRKEGLKKHALVAERHIGAGVTTKDIRKQKLNLPIKNYIPITAEEKIISYADNLVDGNRIRDINYPIERFRKELGEEYAKRIIAQHKEIEKLITNSNRKSITKLSNRKII